MLPGQTVEDGQEVRVVWFKNLRQRVAALFEQRIDETRRGALAQAAARALAADKITVNAFAPGVVRTELWEQLDREFMEIGVTKKPDQAINEFSQSILLGRYSKPEDITGVTTFLASTGSDYMTGQTVMVDGGMVLI